MSREILYSVNGWGIIEYRISHFVRNDKTGALRSKWQGSGSLPSAELIPHKTGLRAGRSNDNLGVCLLTLE